MRFLLSHPRHVLLMFEYLIPKVISFLAFNHFPRIPIARIIADIVTTTLLKRRRGKEHELRIVSERHKTIGITRRNKQHGRSYCRQNMTVNPGFPARPFPIVDSDGANDRCALQDSHILGLLAMCVPRSDETGPKIRYGIESLHVLKAKVVDKRHRTAVVGAEVSLHQNRFLRSGYHPVTLAKSPPATSLCELNIERNVWFAYLGLLASFSLPLSTRNFISSIPVSMEWVGTKPRVLWALLLLTR